MNDGLILTCILLIYFTIGAGLTFKINKRKDPTAAYQNWIKYLVYLGLIFLLFVIIYYFTFWFKFACLWIILVGIYELSMLEIKSLKPRKLFIFKILIIFLALSWLFYSFSMLDRPILLITFFTVSAFDAFSQLMGQLFGKSKIVPQISPNKTVGGFIGGILLSVLTAILIGPIISMHFEMSLFLGFVISISAFVGDLSASAIKRKYQVKDFSHLIPGHGGYLDRFDSFIFAGAMVALLNRFF